MLFLLMAVSGIAYIFYKRYRSLLVTYSHDQKEIAALRSILALNQQVLQSKLLLDLCCGTDYRKEGIVKSIAFLKLEERLKCVSVVLIQVPVSIQLFYNLHKSEFSDAQKICCIHARPLRTNIFRLIGYGKIPEQLLVYWICLRHTQMTSVFWA